MPSRKQNVMNESEFLEMWRKSLDFRLRRSIWLVQLGLWDRQFVELREEVAAFGHAVEYLKEREAPE